jgi:hypothetical protein
VNVISAPGSSRRSSVRRTDGHSSPVLRSIHRGEDLALMQDEPLHFSGPLSFMPGDQYLFTSALCAEPCVYLWTVRSDVDGLHYIHYVGEAKSFAKRQREHLVHVLGLNYGFLDPEDARRGISTWRWPGLWRKKSSDGPGELIERYLSLGNAVLEYLESISIFVAPIHGGQELRRRVEGLIARSLKVNHPAAAMLYPNDNRTGIWKQVAGLRLTITSEQPIAGLDPVLEV